MASRCAVEILGYSKGRASENRKGDPLFVAQRLWCW